MSHLEACPSGKVKSLISTAKRKDQSINSGRCTLTAVERAQHGWESNSSSSTYWNAGIAIYTSECRRQEVVRPLHLLWGLGEVNSIILGLDKTLDRRDA